MIDIKEFKNAMKWGYPAFPFYTSVYFLVAKEPTRKYFCKWNYLAIFKNNQLLGYNSRSISVMGDKIVQDLLSGNREYFDVLKKILNDIEFATERCLNTRKENKLEDLDYWWKYGQQAFSDGANLIFGFDNALNEYLESLKISDIGLYEGIKSNIVESSESFMTSAQKDLIRLVGENPGDFTEAHRKFIEKYSWLQNSYLGKFDITEEWCKKIYEDNKNKNAVKTEAEKLPFDNKYSLLVETAIFAITFRDERKKMFLMLIDLMDEWLKRTCEKKGWEYDDMKWLSMGEVQLCLEGNIDLLERAKKYSKEEKRIGLMNEIGLLDIDEKTFKEIEDLNSPEKNITEFRGTIASKGVVRGIARIVLDVNNDSDKLKDGDILVTSMTRPEYLSLMGKAAAFVTDEGGLTCHAGIVAREMRKPCIIGTKTGTKILKDGDFIEVDANNGIVRII